MDRRIVKSFMVAMGVGVCAGVIPLAGPTRAIGQVSERDVTITGPRGRTVERQMESRVTPFGVDRRTIVRRPGGTFERDVHMARPGGYWGGGGFGPGPRPPVFVERNVFVNGGGGNALGAGLLGAAVGTGAGLLIGSALASPPPQPVYVAPAPFFVTPGTTVVVSPPVRYVRQPPPTVVIDEVALALGRLQSTHETSRRDACYQLGRMGDSRAIQGLFERLKFDKAKDVRVAAATAIGQIGDPGAAVLLQRAITYDKKQEVRDAAAVALARLPKPMTAAAPVMASPYTTPSEPAFEPVERVPPPPVPASNLPH